MSVSRGATHIGAAAFVLGLSLLGPPAGVAVADSGSTGSPSHAGGARDHPKRVTGQTPNATHSSATGTSRRPTAPTGAAKTVTRRPSGGASCAACWGFTAPTIQQGVVTAVNHAFNDAFDGMSSLPANPITDLIEGGLLLVRRNMFGFVPTGVSATQTGNSLTVDVNTGSVAYFRTTGDTIEVSGDPGFGSAAQFSASTVSHVSATGAGNAGCAGFVFTGGTAAADFTTTGIDSLRFESSSAFTGAVDVTSVPGSVRLADGLRGLLGVSVNAPVILARDTEIDAGTANAQFASTVDGGGWFGGQSLTVTALGTTRFVGAVGANTPLGTLTTRGIAPLQIEQSADSKTIPLSFVPVEGAGGVTVKYGIDVAIGDNPSRQYLFDTGGNGFFAGFDPAYFNGVQPGSEQADITYTSGQTLNGLVTPAKITIGSGAHTVSTVVPVDISAVVSATNGSGAPIPVSAPFGGPFAGDFGAAFGVQQINGQVLYAPGSFITSPLFQLPGNLSSGYLAQLGPIGTTPSLTVGITDALRAQFTYAVPISEVLNPDPAYPVSAGKYPISNYPLLQQFGFSPQYLVDNPLPVPVGPGPLPTLIDSGAGSTGLRLPNLPKPGEDGNGNLTTGATLVALFPTTKGRAPLVWSTTAGTIPSVNLVGYVNETGAAIDVPNVNTGLNMFNDFDVMYDVADQVIWLRPNGGQSTVSLHSVTTRGAQTYGQNAQLDGTYTAGGAFSVAGVTQLTGDTTVTARGDVTFSGTVDAATAGGQSLVVNSHGTTTFVRAVGSVGAPAALSTDRGGSTVTAAVATTGAQSYGDDVTLNGAYVAGSGAFTVGGATTVAGPTSVQTTNAAITFGGDVDSAAGAGHVLSVSATGSAVTFNGRIGARNPLGGLVVKNSATATANGPVVLNGSLPNSQGVGLFIGGGVSATFARGGSISGFTNSGVVFDGDSPNSVLTGFTISGNVYDGIQFVGQNYSDTTISGNTIIGNSGFGIETMQATNDLMIRNNTIGANGQTNPWGYTSGGPNAQGIVLASGVYTGTFIQDNTIQYNRRDAIAAPGSVEGVTIRGNTLRYNQGNGIEFTGGDFSGTTVKGNVITGNGGDGIVLGAGIGQALNDFGNPLNGYVDSNIADPADQNPYALGHYVLPYANDPGFYGQSGTADPQVTVSVHGGPSLAVNLDTGSRGLYFDQGQVSHLDTSGGTPGYIYLNSSNRLFFGTWVDTDVTFPDATWSEPTAVPKVAKADVPVLVVTAVGASMTPAPGSTSPSTTFGTKTDAGTVTITNGISTQQVAITAATGGTGTVTIPGGWWATYDDNPGVLASVSNFGVGFDRTGLGTGPTTNVRNQAYNAFLNLTEMSQGTMRPGYVITATGVTLGLDSTVTTGTPYAYTDLAPSGLAQGSQTAPDWQPATGRVTYPSQSQGSDLGPIVIDLGIPSGILTLPGYTASSVFTGALTVDLLNSGGKVGYTVDPSNTANQMTATSVSFFSPLAGVYSQNMPPVSQQFLNTGRRVVAGMNYLYDAAGGYEGLYTVSDRAVNPDQSDAFTSADGTFEAGYYPNFKIPGGVTNLTIEDNTITANAGNGVAVNGQTSTGNAITRNLIYANAGLGIALTNGGNGGQAAPVVQSATLQGVSTVRVTGSVAGTGPFQLQVYSSPAGDAGNVQGRRLLTTVPSSPSDFSVDVDAAALSAGDLITVLATPTVAPHNTSQFSAPVVIG
ncbi:S-layer family protein [Mycobacterium sp. DL592]|uniref:beta strand repeat-containing protein n=1 Tax=Mycobacterium sp. DL592 TaxID=2675524 RepID=UPI00141DC010|nr:right-handed parallel beta-helix repeat-containing protein [Mycobacterium sp. DL592]